MCVWGVWAGVDCVWVWCGGGVYMYTIANSIIKAMWSLLPTLCANILGESVCGVDCVCVWSVCVRGGPTSMGGSFRSRTRRDWRTRLENLGPIAT